jgi:ubiquinone/menaquinone biosynthesis C-methylase UbiE
MTAVAEEKINSQGIQNMKPLFFDLEHQNYTDKFDIIYTQMVMHHVQDVDVMLLKFYSILNPGGFIAIADLYTEDGTFHSAGFNGHLGFDADQLAGKLKTIGFSDIQHQKCYTIEKKDEEGNRAEYPLFLLTASR